LISVFDKTGVVEFARGLSELGWELVSSGGTSAALRDAGLDVLTVESVTGSPEMLSDRVKTLHPKIHGGLLADRDDPSHLADVERYGIELIDLVVSNLYPFSSDPSIQLIDIGGPAMVRAAAKNHGCVAVVVDPSRYDWVLERVAEGGFGLQDRKRLAARAYAHTAAYDTAVASWFANAYAPADDSGFPDFTGATWERADILRYGENPHQRAAIYRHGGGGLAHAVQLHGKAMSYNNYVDTDAARRAAYDFAEPSVAIIKHANPCGIAVGVDVAEAHRKAHACDPVSAYGGVIATNRPVTREAAEQIAEVFTEVVLAPDFDDDALDVLTRKKNIRLLKLAALEHPDPVEFRPISGGMLVQTVDAIDAPGDDPANWTLATGTAADAATLADLEFAWRAVRAVKSNAIVLVDDQATVGAGMGQVNRVDSSRLAVRRAGDRAKGSVAASDAYFPFPDGLQVLMEAGVRAVVQPGGSIRDPEVIAAADAAGVTLYLTGTRHFAH
jgi:phosphoribosylaminoimidazolecarboxamide formyltransferase/IMP cyclohydrolase